MKTTLLILLFILTTNLISGQSTVKNRYKSFDEFYSNLAKKSTLKWTEYELTDTLTSTIRISNDTIEEIFSFKVADYFLKYITKKDSSFFPEYIETSYFTFNNKKINEDTSHAYSDLELTTASITELKGITFLIINGYLKNCNGSFCRAQIDNCFAINKNTIDFQIIEGLQSPSNNYCDINNDGQLDLITFINSSPEGCFSTANKKIKEKPDKYYYCVQLLTLKNGKWEPILDKYKKPYFILFQSDDYIELNGFKILDYNWLYKL